MVLTLVQGAKKYISTKLSGYGADVFTVNRMSSVILSADDYFRYQKRKIVRIEDFYAIRDGCTECSEVGALLNKSTNVVYNGHSSNNTGVRGYTATMMSLNNVDIALGRGFTPADEEHATKGAIVGYDIVDNLLGDGDPLGKRSASTGSPSQSSELVIERARRSVSRRITGWPSPSRPISRPTAITTL